MDISARPLSRVTALASIQSFGPNWFTVTMGTGIVSLMMGRLASIVPPLHAAAVTLWIVNIGLFGLFSAVFVARLLIDPSAIRNVFFDPVQSMFVGAIPMGLATIVNGFVTFGEPLFGARAFRIAEPLWWVDALLSVASGFTVPFLMSVRQSHALERMTGVWLLPIVPAEVAAASAGFLLPHVAHAHQQVLIIAGTLLWAFSVPAALMVLTILFLRLAVHGLPAKELGVSGWLTLGPLGTGSLALVLLGSAAASATAGTPLASIAGAVNAFGIAGGLVLWAYGIWWWMLGIAGTLVQVRRGLPFNMGWWAFTFPLGVFTAATYALASALSSAVFLAAAVTLTILLVLLWLLVAIRTLRGIYSGELA